MKPGDLIRLDNDFWQVESVNLGAEKQEDVIELTRIGFEGPFVSGEPSRRTSLMPHRLLRQLLQDPRVAYYEAAEPRP